MWKTTPSAKNLLLIQNWDLDQTTTLAEVAKALFLKIVLEQFNTIIWAQRYIWRVLKSLFWVTHRETILLGVQWKLKLGCFILEEHEILIVVDGRILCWVYTLFKVNTALVLLYLDVLLGVHLAYYFTFFDHILEIHRLLRKRSLKYLRFLINLFNRVLLSSTNELLPVWILLKGFTWSALLWKSRAFLRLMDGLVSDPPKWLWTSALIHFDDILAYKRVLQSSWLLIWVLAVCDEVIRARINWVYLGNTEPFP